jgi:hypothetical protein
LEYEAHVCSLTAHDIYQLDDGIPERVVLEAATDISPFCEVGSWYSLTARDINQLDDHILESVDLEETTDISPFCEVGYWDWVKLHDKGIVFSDDALVLGKFLDPSIDVNTVLTQQVMKVNGEAENHSMVHLLTPKECVYATLCKKRNGFWLPYMIGGDRKLPSGIKDQLTYILYPTLRTMPCGKMMTVCLFLP